MAYIAAADLRERTRKSWAADIVLTENEGTDAYLDLVIAQVASQVELDLGDDFDPPSPDNDETLLVQGWGTSRLRVPRRVRSLTTVEVLTSPPSTYQTQVSTSYALRKSLNSTGTAMLPGPDGRGRKHDWLEAYPGLTTTSWPCAADAVRLTGKFGWAAVPDDIKRLVALKVYEMVKAKADPLSRITQRFTADATVLYGESREITDITTRYQRGMALVG